jgi:hypothetical protein
LTGVVEQATKAVISINARPAARNFISGSPDRRWDAIYREGGKVLLRTVAISDRYGIMINRLKALFVISVIGVIYLVITLTALVIGWALKGVRSIWRRRSKAVTDIQSTS